MGLLCGGRARRLGAPKETLRHHSGSDLLSFQIERLESHFETILLLVGETIIEGVGPTIRQVKDPRDYRREGPLAGLSAALEVCPTEWLALVPIDNPYFPPQAFAGALEASTTDDLMLGFLDETQHPQWLPGLYRRSLAASARAALVAGVRSLGQFARTQSGRFLTWTDSSVQVQLAYTNMNTTEQAHGAGFCLPELPSSGTSARPARSQSRSG